MDALVDRLRRLIVDSAPDPAEAAPALRCDPDTPLDEVIPFSSLIVLGTVVAIEDELGIRVTRADLARALGPGATLRRLAGLVAELQGRAP
jgi:acyl carrier protein